MIRKKCNFLYTERNTVFVTKKSKKLPFKVATWEHLTSSNLPKRVGFISGCHLYDARTH